MTQTSGDYGWAGGFLINDGSFVQANLMNNSVVKFAYEATSNCYVVLNLGVETWTDGTYAFKVLVNDEVVYSKEAARESDVFAALTNQVVYLAEGDTLALSFNTVIPEGHTGNYERSFFIRKNDIEILTVENELATPEGFESLQQYIDLDGVVPTPVIDSYDELMEEVNNGSSDTMGSLYTAGTLTQQVVYGDVIYDIVNGATETFGANNWTNGFVSETNNIQMNMGTLNGVAPSIQFSHTAEENSYIVFTMDIECWTAGLTLLVDITSNGESVYSKEIEKAAGTDAGVIDQLSKFMVYVSKDTTCTISFSYVVPAENPSLGTNLYLRNTAVEIIEVKEEISLQ